MKPDFEMRFENYILRIYPNKKMPTLEWVNDSELKGKIVEVTHINFVGLDCIVTTAPDGNTIKLIQPRNLENEAIGLFGAPITIIANPKPKGGKKWKR